MKAPLLTQALEIGLTVVEVSIDDLYKIYRSGVYKITNSKNGKSYVGSSVDIVGRISIHFSMLRNNWHYNKHLQSAWNKYGEDCFTFSFLEIVKDKALLNQREQYYMDMYMPEYNAAPKAYTTLGYKMTEEQRMKNKERVQREWDTGKRVASERNRDAARMVGKSNTGRNHGKYSAERVLKTTGDNSPVAKITEKDAACIKYLLAKGEMTQKEIARKYSVTRGCITSINTNKTWVNVEAASNGY